MKILKKCYPEIYLQKRREIHETLEKDIFALNERFCNGEYDSLAEVEKFLTDWPGIHIPDDDMKLKYHLKSR